MIYDLKLTLPIGSFVTYDTEKRKAVKNNLESITSFEKRLSYYNDEVRSLATYEKQGAQIYYEWGNPDQNLKVFCNCNNCRSEPDYDIKQEKVYQKVRAKEIARLKAGIEQAETYKDKLSFLFNTKGFIPDHTPAVWDDHNQQQVISLHPESKEERAVYNQFVIEDFEREYKSGKGFSKSYNGFDFEKEKERLNKRLSNIDKADKIILLQYIRATIESEFGYPESLHTDSRNKHINSHVLQQIDRQLQQMGHIHNLFARLCLDEEIDLLTITGLDSYLLLKFTHTSEVHKYYQYVKRLIEQPDKLRDFAENQPNTDISAPPPVDPMTFIDPLIRNQFLEAEKKALMAANTFSSAIRCAAWCELLYSKKYIKNTNTRQRTMNDFSKTKYGIDIMRALAATREKKAARENHKNNKVNDQIPLKNCF